MAPLPARDQRHSWLRYKDPQYTDKIVIDFEQRLSAIFTRQVNMLYVLDFRVLNEEIDQVRSSLIRELMLEFFSTCRFADTDLVLDVAGTFYEMGSEGFGAYWVGSSREIATKADLRDYLTRISSIGDLLTGVPTYTAIRDPLRRLCHRLIAFSISRRGQAPEKGSKMSGGHFIRRLTEHFKLLTEEKLRGLTVPPPGSKTATPAARTMPQRIQRLKEEAHELRMSIVDLDHNLWDVIVNGDLEEEYAPTGETSAPPAPKTAKQLMLNHSGKQSNQGLEVPKTHKSIGGSWCSNIKGRYQPEVPKNLPPHESNALNHEK
ncbi:hypothetical protein Tco_0893247 [Tanacetum coccineum]|uniref:Uncharacterized protein n=1 Tax=Tanacetum coccineum TaxID=301880 RepID=A0ABQ5C8A2_9ASTR